MTSRNQKSPNRSPVIVVAVENRASARLLRMALTPHYHLQFKFGADFRLKPDLLLLDGASLHQHHSLIRQLRSQAEPMILPALLVSGSQGIISGQISQELGHTVDDIVTLPSSRAELMARIGNLLRLRALSHQQEGARRRLADMVSALRALNACDQVLVRAKKEQELLETLCRRIIEVKDYRLAWVGTTPGKPEPCDNADTDQTADTTIRTAVGRASQWAGTLAQDWRAETLQTSHDIRNSADTLTRHQIAVDKGLVSAIILPIDTNMGEPLYLAIYSDKPGHFSAEERQPLQRLAANLGHALSTLRLQREREDQSARIQQLAYADPLTGLPNRRYLIKYLEDMFNQSEDGARPSAAVLFLDLDGFKLINDVLGHEAGDKVLIQVSQRLRRAVRDSDLVIRHGGDEFLVVMLDAPRTEQPLTPNAPGEFVRVAQYLAARLIEHLKKPIVIDGQEYHLSASIGISLCPDHGRDASTVIQAADTAMYAAKYQGSGTSLLYSAEMFAKRQERLSLKARLRSAIKQNELALHFQPIFNMKSGRIVATEALVRWPQPDGTMIMPETFVPIAEDNGLIKTLGDWILETAARQLQSWHQAGYQLRMAINISAHQLYPEGNADWIADMVRRHIDPAWITLEITESVLMTEPSEMEALLHRLNAHGFRIAIDDFGTGYSSLSRIQHLPVQILKIDRSFVAKLNQADKGAAMIPIIQQMAASFGLEIIAEGIENKAQYDYLRDAGVEMGQGFWFGRPVPENEIRHHIELPDSDNVTQQDH